MYANGITSQMISAIPRNKLELERRMILPEDVERRFLSIEKEFKAKKLLSKYNLMPKRKILFHGPPGCGKTLGAKRIAWNLDLPLFKVKFDSLLSSYFGESMANLRKIFEYSQREPGVLLLDECDSIAKSRLSTQQDIGETLRIVNALLILLDEYEAPGLLIATTNLKITLDEALFRRFDDVLKIPTPEMPERIRLIEMTLSAIPIDFDADCQELAQSMKGRSSSDIVSIVRRAAKASVLDGSKKISSIHFEQALSESQDFGEHEKRGFYSEGNAKRTK